MSLQVSIEILSGMLRVRRVEEALADRYAEQEMRCPMHLCIGQEGVAVGVCTNLENSDVVFSNHRAHGHYLAKGGDLDAMVAELYGRETGCCGGRGGSMHLIDQRAGFLGSTPIVGGTIPLAVGAAWTAALKQTGQVAVVFFGDGCFEEGVLHESMNFAALHRLPVVFVCENNGFSVYTHLRERQPDRPIHQIAAAHGLGTYCGDGNDVEDVLQRSHEAIEKARHGGGPQFLEFSVYRWREHCGPNFDDELDYRTSEEIERGLQQCPIQAYIGKLRIDRPDINETVKSLETSIQSEIKLAFDRALAAPFPSSDVIGGRLYA